MTRTAGARPRVDPETVARLRLAVMRLARRLRQQAEPGVSASQLAALSTLDVRGPMTLGELAARERVQPPSMTPVVARLEGLGLVDKKIDADDRRIVWVSLSRAGKKLVARNRTRRNAYLVKRLGSLEDAELEAVRNALPVLERLLEEDV
jgi:DNA-binding MarR family transcriptional regulator